MSSATGLECGFASIRFTDTVVSDLIVQVMKLRGVTNVCNGNVVGGIADSSVYSDNLHIEKITVMAANALVTRKEVLISYHGGIVYFSYNGLV